MRVPFFDLNPVIVQEMREKDHHTREYRKLIQKMLFEIGGPAYLLKVLKTSDGGNQHRRKYFRHLILTGSLVLLMFVWLLIAVLLTGGRDTDQLLPTDIPWLIAFIVVIVANMVLVLVLAFRSKKILLDGVSYLIDHYQADEAGPSTTTLSGFTFEKAKANRNAILISIVFFFVAYSLVAFNNGTFSRLLPPQPKVFTKAGLTITLTRDFREQDVVTQTAAFTSKDHIIICLKEEFAVFKQNGMRTDLTLTEYAQAVIDFNSFNATLAGTESRPHFVYTRQANGKDMTCWTTVKKGSDAYWTIAFVCETKNYAASQKQFTQWADTIKVA